MQKTLPTLVYSLSSDSSLPSPRLFSKPRTCSAAAEFSVIRAARWRTSSARAVRRAWRAAPKSRAHTRSATPLSSPEMALDQPSRKAAAVAGSIRSSGAASSSRARGSSTSGQQRVARRNICPKSCVFFPAFFRAWFASTLATRNSFTALSRSRAVSSEPCGYFSAQADSDGGSYEFITFDTTRAQDIS
jgi:hypothetical protein